MQGCKMTDRMRGKASGGCCVGGHVAASPRLWQRRRLAVPIPSGPAVPEVGGHHALRDVGLFSVHPLGVLPDDQEPDALAGVHASAVDTGTDMLQSGQLFFPEPDTDQFAFLSHDDQSV